MKDQSRFLGNPKDLYEIQLHHETYTEPGLQGDRSSAGSKPATLETGISIQVPLFIKQDEVVLVDTRTGEYLGRAN